MRRPLLFLRVLIQHPGFRIKHRFLFRRGRFAELLKARIIPQRIEHGIEPEQRGSERRNLSEKFSLLFRRQRGDDFLKARIAAERVPEGQKFERAVAQRDRRAGSTQSSFQLLQG